MNHTQKLVSFISGYEPKECGAQDDGFYETEDKIEYLKDVVLRSDEDFSLADIFKARDFMMTDFDSDNDRFYAFKTLTNIISPWEVLNFFRSDSIDDLDEFDREEIILACCAHSDYLTELVKEALAKEEQRVKDS